MSCFFSEAKRKKEDKFETVEMIDDFYGKHEYGIRFANGDTYREEDVILKPNKPTKEDNDTLGFISSIPYLGNKPEPTKEKKNPACGITDYMTGKLPTKECKYDISGKYKSLNERPIIAINPYTNEAEVLNLKIENSKECKCNCINGLIDDGERDCPLHGKNTEPTKENNVYCPDCNEKVYNGKILNHICKPENKSIPENQVHRELEELNKNTEEIKKMKDDILSENKSTNEGEICIRCGCPKKDKDKPVGCYVYGDKVANRHSYKSTNDEWREIYGELNGNF